MTLKQLKEFCNVFGRHLISMTIPTKDKFRGGKISQNPRPKTQTLNVFREHIIFINILLAKKGGEDIEHSQNNWWTQ
jgi:hypothetical protein